jgi:hypothetical protein
MASQKESRKVLQMGFQKVLQKELTKALRLALPLGSQRAD